MSDGAIKTRRFRDAKRADGTVRQEIYLPRSLAEAIDGFRESHDINSRTEAIRRLCELGLKANDLLMNIHTLRELAEMHAVAPFDFHKTRRSRQVRSDCGPAGSLDIASDNLSRDRPDNRRVEDRASHRRETLPAQDHCESFDELGNKIVSS